MPRRRPLLSLLAAGLLAALPLLPPPAQARPPARQEQGPLSLSQAAELVRGRVGGQVLSAEAVAGKERSYYLIRVLVRKGQVKVFRVDPMTGQIF